MVDTKTEKKASREEAMVERFARDTQHHQLYIRHDDGLYRHLKCVSQDRSAYWFEIITTPGQLTISGDVDTFVFRRLDDMFRFFRRGERGDVNPHYWGEKVVDGRDRIHRYSPARFRTLVNEHFDDAVAAESIPAEHVTAARSAVEAYVLRFADEEEETEARAALESFSYAYNVTANPMSPANPRQRREWWFTDTWEWDLKDFDEPFVWCCHAIVWAIDKYDKARAAAGASS